MRPSSSHAAPSRAKWSDLFHLTLDHASARPIFQQIYLALREAVVANTLAPVSKLPSSRDLALRLKVSRTSIVSAYDQLLAEGYAVGREGSGTYVSHDVPSAIVTPTRVAGANGTASRQVVSVAGARYGRQVPDHWPPHAWDWLAWAEFSYPFNLSHCPAVSVPCGLTQDGLPIGLQIVGTRLSDPLVMRAARAFLHAQPFAALP